MKARVKRCPFCNCHNIARDVNAVFVWLKCHECGASGPTATTLRGAVQGWNEGYNNPDALVATRNSNRDDKRTIEI